MILIEFVYVQASKTLGSLVGLCFRVSLLEFDFGSVTDL